MFTRYTSHASVRDLDDIIALHRRAIHSMSLQGVRHFVLLNHLAEALCERWYQLTQKNDIDESISLFEEALDLYTTRDERRAIILGNLAQALVYLSLKVAEASRYSSAVSLLREALSIALLHDDVLAILKIRLCWALRGYNFNFVGKTNGLQEVAEIARSAVNLLPISHRDQPEALLSLGRALADIDLKEPGTETQNYTGEARLLLYQALDAQSPTHPRRPVCLYSLVYRLGSDYDRGRGNKSDLDERYRLLREAMALLTPSHIAYPSILSGLSVESMDKFYRSHNREELDYSVALQEKVVNARALSDMQRYTSVHNLADRLDIRYKHFNDPADLRRAISLGHEALSLCPPGHGDHLFMVLVLSERLILDPNCLVADIDGMVGLIEAALEEENYKPEVNRSGKSAHLDMMGRLLHARFLRLRDPKDQARLAELFEAAVEDQASSFRTRFRAVKQWISAAESIDSLEMAMKAYRIAIHISPYRVYPGLDLSSQLDQLKRDFATISCDAACCGLVTADALEALNLLEQGRATFWAQRLQLRVPSDALPSDLAEKLHITTGKLQEYHSRKRTYDASGEQYLLEQRLHHEEFQQLLREARQYPNFTDYLRPLKIEELAETVGNGVLIVLLSSKTYGSFAIIIRGRSPKAEKLPLPSIAVGDLQSMVEEFQVSMRFARQEMRNAANGEYGRLKLAKVNSGRKNTPDVMARLWSAVGEPIMCHLGMEVRIQQPTTSWNLPLRKLSAMFVI
jgi:tetratricopeptide (TPR) repeat protein